MSLSLIIEHSKFQKQLEVYIFSENERSKISRPLQCYHQIEEHLRFQVASILFLVALMAANLRDGERRGILKLLKSILFSDSPLHVQLYDQSAAQSL